MTEPTTLQGVATPSAVSLWLVLPVLLAGMAGWLVAHRLARGWTGRRPWIPVAFRGAAEAAVLWGVLGLGSRGIVWASGWSPVTLAVCGAAGLEAVAALYERERRILPAKQGRTVTLLRAALFLLVLLALAQPHAFWFKTRVIERRVAVLVDESASMRDTETLWTPSQIFDLGALSGAATPPQRPAFEDLRLILEDLRRLIARSQTQAALVLELADVAEGRKPGEAAANFLKSAGEMHARLTAWERGIKPGARTPEILKLLAALRDAAIAPLETLGAPAKARTAGKTEDSAVASLLGNLDDRVNGLLPELAAAQETYDRNLLAALPEPARKALAKAVTVSRRDVADRLLSDKSRGGAGLLRLLSERYRVAIYAFGGDTTPLAAGRWIDRGQGGADGAFAAVSNDTAAVTSRLFQARTDLGRALDRVGRDMPAEELAGVLVLSDGLHNGESSVDVPARRLGAPIRTILIGGRQIPVDAAVLNVRAPDAVPLHDRVRVAADVRITGAKDTAFRVFLARDGNMVDERVIRAASNDFRTEVRLSHLVEEDAPARYAVAIEPLPAGQPPPAADPDKPASLPGEQTLENNRWEFDVAVSDERTSVLLVDSYPRWEFRYLRNLFYGRDKTVHLQYVLLDPDTLLNAPPPAPVPASAGRPYGQAEANQLPATPEEWRKFSVIILGDLPPEALDAAAIGTIRECVTRRGALLVVVAGPRFMPRCWTSEAWRELMPARWTARPEAEWSDAPENAFRLIPTATGRVHPVMQIAESDAETDAAWSSLEPLRWRFPIEAVKAGAEVLAYAEPAPSETPRDNGGAAAGGTDRRALVVAQRAGAGKVLLLLSDETWRLRYQIGDTFHHRLWGQIIRWGIGERLQAGGEFVRLGATPQSGRAGDTVRLLARLQDAQRAGVKAAGVTVGIYRDTHRVDEVPLTCRDDAEGLHEGRWKTPEQGGVFRLRLEGAEAEKLRAAVAQPPVEMTLQVRRPDAQVEKGHLNADPAVPRRVAQLSGGVVCNPSPALGPWLDFGPPARRERERLEASLWDTWPYLLLLAGVAAAEWVLRRKGGLP